uniref:Uncharacterized protein n=1 Tax=Ananas comosus var. bracteatus TaxID=296719 RepID=A0A6V7PYZ8_ANACO|nr:unnamed protein product [Ananas comosus var. bracteatus]
MLLEARSLPCFQVVFDVATFESSIGSVKLDLERLHGPAVLGGGDQVLLRRPVQRRRRRGINYLKPNKNCNSTSWVSGCEPGWACAVGPDQTPASAAGGGVARYFPSRTQSCAPAARASSALAASPA